MTLTIAWPTCFTRRVYYKKQELCNLSEYMGAFILQFCALCSVLHVPLDFPVCVTSSGFPNVYQNTTYIHQKFGYLKIFLYLKKFISYFLKIILHANQIHLSFSAWRKISNKNAMNVKKSLTFGWNYCTSCIIMQFHRYRIDYPM